jgi:3-hydroxybutyryl-CoA dehydrogenase
VHDRVPGAASAWVAGLGDPPGEAGAAYAATTIAEAVTGCDLVIEVVPEDETLKAVVLREISAAALPGCIIATNTSSFSIDVLGVHCKGAERFLGVHFFNPADVIPGVEVIPGTGTDPGVVDRVLALLTDAGKRPAVVRSSPGFIANRLQMALFLECLRCVDEDLVSPDDLDTVVSTTFGFRLPAMGPFAVADMAGLDVYVSILTTLRDAFGDRFQVPAALSELTSAGHYGTKTGQGFFTYGSEDVVALVQRRDAAYARLARAVEPPSVV